MDAASSTFSGSSLPSMPRTYRGALAFLHRQEGHGGDLYGRSAYWPEGLSGVTLDPGYDLGHGDPNLLRYYDPFLTEEQMAACRVALGHKGEAAHAMLKSGTTTGRRLRSIWLSRAEAERLLPALAAPYWQAIARRFRALLAGVPRGAAVPKSAQEVFLSLAYNRGAGNRDLEQLRAPLAAADYEEVAARIEAMEEEHERRVREAEHLRAGLAGEGARGDVGLVQRGLRKAHPLPAAVLGGAGAFAQRFQERFGWSTAEARIAAPPATLQSDSSSDSSDSDSSDSDSSDSTGSYPVAHDHVLRKVKSGGLWGVLGALALTVLGWVEPQTFSFLGHWAPLLVALLQFGAGYLTRSSTRDFPSWDGLASLSSNPSPDDLMQMTHKDKKSSQSFFCEVIDELLDDEGDKALAIEKVNALVDLPDVSEQGEAVIFEQVANGLILAYNATKPDGEE